MRSDAKILIVGDDAGARMLLQNITGGLGIQVLIAGSAGQALEIPRARESRMVVTDLAVAGGEGIDSVKTIRRESIRV